MKKTTIYIVRHGQTQWNAEKRMQGQCDSPLTEQGIRQATWLRDALHNIDFDAIYSSSSPRARRTAEILRHQRERELTLHNDLQEIYMGSWEGKTQQELRQNHAAAYTAFWETPHLYHPENGGESFHDMQSRVIPLIDSLLTRQQGKTILIVTHTVTLKIIMSHFEKRSLAQLWHPPYIHPTALCKVIIENQQPSIELHGDISHYQD
jgi:probable phosphoglycerate mutase